MKKQEKLYPFNSKDKAGQNFFSKVFKKVLAERNKKNTKKKGTGRHY